uniref:NADH-ubiquinone oxidoreductase chain 5 n=1 Tax=Hyperolius marmoratus TaxID=476017 RepID=W0THU1_HYPMR|nr:NADH dehydrogenase subunit 5 [Hyperolius marmoratus]BAO42920.1 NADH dehydrogenase subunit 5 [Hyperolius marmoratus]
MDLNVVMMSCLILILLLLFYPLFNLNSKNFIKITTNALKMAFTVSIFPLLLFVNQGVETITMHYQWLHLGYTNIDIALQFDYYSTVFLPIALFVTWNILDFTTWYMQSDPKSNIFFKYLLIFLMMMIILISANNLFILFIGWEGVGIMSFMLIGWYHARSNAGTAALQAVLYNRIGDIGFMFAICWLIMNTNSITLQHMFSMQISSTILVMMIIAAASKSAQFSLHPWLASAMEGPTPVSALLHSSTMVVAGIFLLIRIHPLLEKNMMALTTCLCLGAISTAFATTCALTQNDIKKIIAYSTSSQLGLMMVAIGLNFPHLAFFHICTHAFFKAMLFLCSGSIIHNLNDEQDIRKMGGLQNILPVTMSCITIGSLALMGTPFLAGFFSKDAIIESMNTSFINMWALLMTLIATSFTAIYSLRLMFFSSIYYPRFNPSISINENNPMIIKPLKRLALGSIISGVFLMQFILPNNPITHTMPTYMKMTALIITIMALIIATDLAKMSWTSTPVNNKTKLFDTTFYNYITHRLLTSMILNTSLRTIYHLMNIIWLEKMGPLGLTNIQLPPSQIIQKSQSGMIKSYLSVFAVTLFIMIILQLV